MRPTRRQTPEARKAEAKARKAHQAEQARLAGQTPLQGNMTRRAAEIRARREGRS